MAERNRREDSVLLERWDSTSLSLKMIVHGDGGCSVAASCYCDEDGFET